MKNTDNNTENEITRIGDPSIYDGWCVEFNVKTKEIVWRDAWFTNRLSEEFKRNWENTLFAANPYLKENP